jgi:hypothetical protein
MGYGLRIGFRHLESIRSQTVAVAMSVNWAKRRFSLRDWLQDQAPELIPYVDRAHVGDDLPHEFSHDRVCHYAIILNSILVFFEGESEDPWIRHRFRHSLVSSSQSEHSEEDYAGSAKGGWWSAESFAFQAGIIFTLGAVEEFERSVLRVLTGVQSAGRTYVGETKPYRPRLADFEAVNPIWIEHEQRRRTHTYRERSRLLQDFGISPPDVSA